MPTAHSDVVAEFVADLSTRQTLNFDAVWDVTVGALTGPKDEVASEVAGSFVADLATTSLDPSTALQLEAAWDATASSAARLREQPAPAPTPIVRPSGPELYNPDISRPYIPRDPNTRRDLEVVNAPPILVQSESKPGIPARSLFVDPELQFSPHEGSVEIVRLELGSAVSDDEAKMGEFTVSADDGPSVYISLNANATLTAIEGLKQGPPFSLFVDLKTFTLTLASAFTGPTLLFGTAANTNEQCAISFVKFTSDLIVAMGSAWPRTTE